MSPISLNLSVMLALIGAAVLAWKWAGGDGVFRFNIRHLVGVLGRSGRPRRRRPALP